jgi:hypothetical protein
MDDDNSDEELIEQIRKAEEVIKLSSLFLIPCQFSPFFFPPKKN